MINLDPKQHEALELVSDPSIKLAGVTGAAGTGKTTLLKYAYEALEDSHPRRILVAPTGRAAKRIEEATGIPAMTIHRMMRYSMPADEEDITLPAYDKFNKYPYDAVFIDETSMVSEELYRGLVDAAPSNTVLRFFGDANQLPPVEGLSPFLRLLKKFPAVTLEKNYRSSDGIIQVSQSIISGRIPEANDKFTMLKPGSTDFLPIIDEYVDDSYRGMNSQVIIPMKVGKYGTIAINNYIQKKLNPRTKFLLVKFKSRGDEQEERKFRIGDKVIWTKNDYKLHLYNGQIGWIINIDFDSGELIVNFDGKDKLIPTHLESYDQQGKVIFPYDPRKQLDLAYAITTHKSQGSEFDRVLLLLQRGYVLNRQNFYTAVTRAKQHVTAVFGPGALMKALEPAKIGPST